MSRSGEEPVLNRHRTFQPKHQLSFLGPSHVSHRFVFLMDTVAFERSLYLSKQDGTMSACFCCDTVPRVCMSHLNPAHMGSTLIKYNSRLGERRGKEPLHSFCCCVAWGKLLKCSEPAHPPENLRDGANYQTELFQKCNAMTQTKYLAPSISIT